MRELTGYEDKHGRPILEGDIVTWRAAGEIHVIEEVSEGWFPMSFCDDAEVAALEIIGSAYTEQGRRLLADSGLPAVDDEGELVEDYEARLDPRPARMDDEDAAARLQRRRAVQANEPPIFYEIMAILARHDPMDIVVGDNIDEYDLEVTTILPRLPRASSLEEVASIVHDEFVAWFDPDVDEDRLRAASREIWSAWHRYSDTPG